MLAALDTALLRLLRSRLHQPPVERAVLLFTRLGEHGALWLCIAGMAAILDPRGRPVYRHAAEAVLLAYALNTAIKWSIRRARPLLEDLPPLAPTLSRLSYPSAHSSMAFAGTSVLAERLPRRPLRTASIAMALSRPYCGVHYPSDVAAGALLGTAAAALARRTP